MSSSVENKQGDSLRKGPANIQVLGIPTLGDDSIILEAFLHSGSNSTKVNNSYAVIVTHPHPRLGGDAHNNVTKGVSNYLSAKLNCPVLRYNSRGVGRSNGISSWFGGPEVDDLIACIAAVKDGHGPVGAKRIYVVGYSFGSSILGTALKEIFTLNRLSDYKPSNHSVSESSGHMTNRVETNISKQGPLAEVEYKYQILAGAIAGAIFVSYPCGFFPRFLLGHHIESLREVSKSYPLSMHFIQGDSDEMTSAGSVASIVSELGSYTRSKTLQDGTHSWWRDEKRLSESICQSIAEMESQNKADHSSDSKSGQVKEASKPLLLPKNFFFAHEVKGKPIRSATHAWVRKFLIDQNGYFAIIMLFLFLAYLIAVLPHHSGSSKPWYMRAFKTG